MGKTEYEGDDVAAGLLAMDGSRVWINFHARNAYSMPFRGWDLGPSGLSPFGDSPKPPEKLCFNNTKLWDNSLCRILDTVTGKVVFQLPPQFGTPVDIKRNGQYLVASFQSKMELILEFHPEFFQ